MRNTFGNAGDDIEIDTGSEVIQLTGPVTMINVFHAPTLTTLQFVQRQDMDRLELIGVRVWKHWRDACKNTELRGTPVIISCDSYGPTTWNGNHLIMGAMDASNVGCICIALYPDWTDARHEAWQKDLFADAGNDHAEALRTAWSAIISDNAQGNPSLEACMTNLRRLYGADVTGYRKQME